MSALIVHTAVPEIAVAERIAKALLEARVAACVNIGPPLRSLYHWRGKIEMAQEIPLLAKTTSDCYAEVERLILSLHPYELPEIVAVPIGTGLPSYLTWIESETRQPETRAI